MGFGGSDDVPRMKRMIRQAHSGISTQVSTKPKKRRVASQFLSVGSRKCDLAPQNNLFPSSTTLTNRTITKYNDKQVKEMIDCSLRNKHSKSASIANKQTKGVAARDRAGSTATDRTVKNSVQKLNFTVSPTVLHAFRHPGLYWGGKNLQTRLRTRE